MPWDEIDADAAGFYRRVLQTLDDAGLRFLVGGAFAFSCFTGIYRNTKDLDLFIAREDYGAIAQSLRDAGDFRCEKCRKTTHVKAGETIPKCPNCGNETYGERENEPGNKSS